ncbi:MAG: capsule assembly Wzi family protein [Sphingobacteriia bacterium]
MSGPIRYLLLALIPTLCITRGIAQDGDLPLNDEVYHLIDRYDIQGRLPEAIPSTLKPYGREVVTEWLRQADQTGLRRRALSWQHRSRILVDDDYARENGGEGLGYTFFTNHRDLISWQVYKGPDSIYLDERGLKRARKGGPFNAKVFINPVVYGGYGLEQTDLGTESSRTVYRNSRGASLRASLFGKVGVYTEVLDNQVEPPVFFQERVRARSAIPGEGFYKTFRTDGYDYLSAKGYLTYSPVKPVRIKLGRDRVHWGDGYQSMLLSDHATDYYMLNFHTRIWKLEYMNHFTQMIDLIPNKPDAIGAQPRKYGVFHHLAFRPNKKWSIGIFESVIYAPVLPNGNRGFEIQYLNPLIFYRTIEQYVGSPDNSTLGLTGKVNVLRRLQLYGQLMIDDYNFAQRANGSGYWGNKFGLQGGLKYIDVLGIETLDMQLEANTARPYTYAHYNISANYAHYNQPLAHPQGANFREFTGILRYQPLPRFFVQATVVWLDQGLDQNGQNLGADIFRANGTQPNDFGNTIGQGLRYRQLQVQGRVSYQIWWLNAFVDAELFVRAQDVPGPPPDRTTWATLSLRWNIPHQPLKF